MTQNTQKRYKRNYELRICFTCNKEKRLRTYEKNCSTCNCKRRQDRFPIIECACGCRALIPSIDTKGQPKYFKKSHMNKGPNHPMWNGGIKINSLGYILQWCPTHHFPDALGYVRQHRLVYEEHHKLCLLPWSVVHHIDGNKKNNQWQNLKSYPSNSSHMESNHRINTSNRNCELCGSNDTYIEKKRGYTRWFRYKEKPGYYLCASCHTKVLRQNKKSQVT